MTLSDPTFWHGLVDQRVAISLRNGDVVEGRVDDTIDHPSVGQPFVYIKRVDDWKVRVVVPLRHAVAVRIGGEDD